MAKKSTKTKKPKNVEDKFRTTLDFEDVRAAREFVRKYPLDLVETNLIGDGKIARLVHHMTKKSIKRLKREGYKPEVHENITEIGRERQKEIGDGDRFQEGQITPRSRNLTKQER